MAQLKTTNSTDFNLDFNNIAEEAFERCGVEMRTGYDLKTARRSLNLLILEWANRGINLWTVDQGSIPLVTGQSTYNLPADTVDLLDHVIRTGSGQNQLDINITRISGSTYAMIPNKNATGRPIQVWINRQTGAIGSQVQPIYTVASCALNLFPGPNDYEDYIYLPVNPVTLGITAGMYVSGNYIQPGTQVTAVTVNGDIGYPGFVQLSLPTTNYSNSVIETVQFYTQNPANNPTINIWPAPNAGTSYTFYYWRLRRMYEVGNGVNAQDVPFRFLPCMVAGLAYYLSMKLPGAEMRSAGLKAEYESQFQLAADEDREKAAVRFVPRETFLGYR